MLPYLAFLSLCKFCLIPCFCIHSNPPIHLSSPLLHHNSKSEEFMTVTMANTTLNIRMTCSHTHSVLRVNTFNIWIGIRNVLHWIHTLWHAASLSLSLSLQVLSLTLFLLLPQTLIGKSVLFILHYFIYCKCTVTGQKCCITWVNWATCSLCTSWTPFHLHIGGGEMI